MNPKTKKLIKENVNADKISFTKQGTVKFYRTYFYRHGKTERDFSDSISNALNIAGIKFKLIGSGDHFTQFRGGASIPQSSHWWAEYEILVN